MIHNVIGNLLTSNCDYICHQVNCQGVMGSGIAKQIRDKWPWVYDYYRNRLDYLGLIGVPCEEALGNVDIVLITDSEPDRFVLNLYAQDNYGYNGLRYTSYDAFAMCLGQVSAIVPKGHTIGFPKNIGCGLGGGNWKVIYALIEEILGKDYEVYIYEYFGE